MNCFYEKFGFETCRLLLEGKGFRQKTVLGWEVLLWQEWVCLEKLHFTNIWLWYLLKHHVYVAAKEIIAIYVILLWTFRIDSIVTYRIQSEMLRDIVLNLIYFPRTSWSGVPPTHWFNLLIMR